MAWVTILFCNFCTGILSIILARKKHRPSLMWFLLTLPFGVVALFVLLALRLLRKTEVRKRSSNPPDVFSSQPAPPRRSFNRPRPPPRPRTEGRGVG